MISGTNNALPWLFISVVIAQHKIFVCSWNKLVLYSKKHYTAHPISLHSSTRDHDNHILVDESNNSYLSNRRRLVMNSFALLQLLSPLNAMAEEESTSVPFQSNAFRLREYTNSITASRDTNISPSEAYDTIASLIPPTAPSTSKRALDLGAGAGVSTQFIFEKGYQTIDAVDWSREAWDRFVPASETSVKFHEMDADTFRSEIWRHHSLGGYDLIVFNFAINEFKAVSYAKEMLSTSKESVLIAPINQQTDYWLKQSFRIYDCHGTLIRDVGDVIDAWNVQFQPDVSEDTCQGIWCPPYNGFKKKRK